LLAIVLNSFAELATGAELADLDNTIIQAFRAEGSNDDQLKEHGRLPDAFRSVTANAVP
jgi:hypothetical protein